MGPFVVVEARLADPVLAAQIGCVHPSLVFLQDRKDLLFRVPLALLVTIGHAKGRHARLVV